MYITIGRLTLKEDASKRKFFWYTFTSLVQAKFSKGIKHSSIHAENNIHFWTKTAWRSKEDAMNYRNNGRHKKAMQLTKNLASKADFISWQGNKVPNWTEAMKKLKDHFAEKNTLKS